ncbi:MAG: DNA-binding transcriptional regulator Fis [Gammaproteobacteria bacterium]|nr:DNA-binding transcriptional regulator Fis [Gammaproteobacteria bacterium]
MTEIAPLNPIKTLTGENSPKENFSQESLPLRESVSRAMKNYFHHLDGQDTQGVYQMVLSEVEAPLLESVMAYTGKNQSKAAILLGINRGTLRTKLKQYGLIE